VSRRGIRGRERGYPIGNWSVLTAGKQFRISLSGWHARQLPQRAPPVNVMQPQWIAKVNAFKMVLDSCRAPS
jgi:hypothetical protein